MSGGSPFITEAKEKRGKKLPQMQGKRQRKDFMKEVAEEMDEEKQFKKPQDPPIKKIKPNITYSE